MGFSHETYQYTVYFIIGCWEYLSKPGASIRTPDYARWSSAQSSSTSCAQGRIQSRIRVRVIEQQCWWRFICPSDSVRFVLIKLWKLWHRIVIKQQFGLTRPWIKLRWTLWIF